MKSNILLDFHYVAYILKIQKNITLGICELPNDLSKYFGRGKIAKDARKAVLTNTFDGELLTFSVRILNDFTRESRFARIMNDFTR